MIVCFQSAVEPIRCGFGAYRLQSDERHKPRTNPVHRRTSDDQMRLKSPDVYKCSRLVAMHQTLNPLILLGNVW
jgi:hypothetical protein